MTKTQELEVVAWRSKDPDDVAWTLTPFEPIGGLPIREPLVTEASASAIIKGLEERIEALMRERTSLIETKREQIAFLEEQARDDQREHAKLHRAAESERDALLGVLKAVSDTSHRTPDRKHYQFPLAIMQRVDAALSGSKVK